MRAWYAIARRAIWRRPSPLASISRRTWAGVTALAARARRNDGRGDQLVIVNVAIPQKLSPDQRKLFEQLAQSLGSEVKPQERSFVDWLKETLGG